jgi:hypothetical protein
MVECLRSRNYSKMRRRDLIAGMAVSVPLASAILTAFAAKRASAGNMYPQATPAAIEDEHCSFLIGVRSELNNAVFEGRLPINARETVRCPLCQKEVTISAVEPTVRDITATRA